MLVLNYGTKIFFGKNFIFCCDFFFIFESSCLVDSQSTDSRAASNYLSPDCCDLIRCVLGNGQKDFDLEKEDFFLLGKFSRSGSKGRDAVFTWTQPSVSVCGLQNVGVQNLGVYK